MSTRGMLQSKIEEITKEMLPMHMPGHKRRLRPSDCLPYDWDVTEISGADDLHAANGILKEAMERASALWGSRRTFFLVGGSTCGLLAAIRAAAPFGSEIIAARNCHRSVYHAIELGGYKVHWIIPGQDRKFGISRQIGPDQVRSMLRRYPYSTAVILTSPTYEGVVSDIETIARLCHRFRVPLIVDEAHGAHFGLFEEGGFPESAVRLGADAVVQSIHKTLPSLTQTALLHIGGDLLREREVERQLGIFETSSPSYPLMISIDSCVHLLEKKGPALFAAWKEGLDEFYLRAEKFRYLRILGVHGPEENREDRTSRSEEGGRRDRSSRGREDENSSRPFRGQPTRDRSKILISFEGLSMSGAGAAEILREQYGIETEMSSGSCVLAMTGLGDSEETIRYLADMLFEMEDAIEPAASGRPAAAAKHRRENEPVGIPAVRTACRILDAVQSGAEEVPMNEAEGRICGEYLYAYPPGIPILAPGEYIDQDHIRIIRQTEADGGTIHHTHAETPERIVCLEE